MYLDENEVSKLTALERQYNQESNTSNFSLEVFVDKWRNFAAQIKEGYQLSVYDYTNDLSVRTALERFLQGIPTELRDKILEEVQGVDEDFRSVTEPSGLTLMGTAEAFQSQPWWYHRVPRKLVAELKEDLAELRAI